MTRVSAINGLANAVTVRHDVPLGAQLRTFDIIVTFSDVTDVLGTKVFEGYLLYVRQDGQKKGI